ncbi:MAG: hypothetical protein AB9844_04135 [Clostridiaceae bacterium]
MKNFLDNWDYKKHAVAVTAFYLGVAIVGNAILSKKADEKEKPLSPDTTCCNMSKKQKNFSGILAGCYSFDMSATYLILNCIKKHYK